MLKYSLLEEEIAPGFVKASESNDVLLVPANIQRAAKGCASSEMCSESENQ